MRRIIAGLVPAVLVTVALATLSSCRKETPPQSDLDRFVYRYKALPVTEQVDSLRALLHLPGQYGTYATFQLGNAFYVMASDSAAAEGWNNLGARAYLDSSEIYLENAIARDSSFVEAYVNLGSLCDDRANIVLPGVDRQVSLERAQVLYESALKLSPDDEKARCNLGSLHLRQRRQMQAVEQFQYVLDRNPESSLAHYNLAIMFAEAKIYREAIREWELAAKYDPGGDIGERSRDNVDIVKKLQEQSARTVQRSTP